MAQHKSKSDNLSRADGSALYSLGATIIQAAVYGPGDVKFSNRHHDRMHIDVCFVPKCGSQAINEKALEAFICDTVKDIIVVEMHPRTAVSIILQEMQTDGPLLAPAINASCLALLDAGVEMKSVFGAVSCCVTKDDVCIIDPSEVLTEDSKAVVTCVFEGVNEQMIAIQLFDEIPSNLLTKCINQCQIAVKDVFRGYRQFIDKKYSLFHDTIKGL